MPESVTIRPERPEEAEAIGRLITEAFLTAKRADGTEAAIVDRLRTAGALTVSLVAEEGGEIAGHVALSPVTLDGRVGGWYGLGPLAVRLESRRRGIGAALVRAGLERLREAGAAGCLLVGDPAYYTRFGFASRAGLILPGVPAGVTLALPFTEPAEAATGTIAFHAAFGLD